MATLIQVRRDTQANWTASNPILASGEIAFSTDQYKIKIGDGVSNWSALSYITATPTEITNQINAAISNVIDSAPGTLDTLNELAAALNDDPTFFTTVATNLSNHESDTTNIHGIANTADLATKSYADNAVSTHSSDTTDIHGISNTANLVYTNDSRLSDSRTPNAHASTHGAAGSDPITIAQSQVTNLTTDLSSKASTTDLTNHTSDTTDVHGITNTANLVYTDDSRLSDARTPTSHTHPTSDITNFTEDVQDVVGGMVSSNTESGISVTYDDELGKINFDVSDPTLTFTGDATGSGTVTNLGSTSIELTVTDNSHNHTASNISDFAEATQDVVGAMVDSNTESGIAVSYDDESGKLNFNVNDPTITLSGDVTGSATMTDLGNVTITTTIASDSVVLGTDTAGDYVATIAGTENQITVSGTGTEGRAATLAVSSSFVFPGTVTLNSAPTQSLHAATKQYVDEVAEGLKAKPAVEIATTGNLDATYSNGTNGVGATLTANSNGAFPEIDGITLSSTTSGENGVLVKNQSNPAHNGRYNLTQVGDVSNPWILTRCGLCDQSSEIPGIYTFVKSGTLYKGTGWVQTVSDPSTFVIGTDNILVTQFSGAGTYTAGTGLSLNGTIFNNAGVLSLTGTTNEIEVSGSTGNITISLPETINANISGNAATVTNGVVTTGSYSDPSWITGLAWSKISSTPTTLSGYGISDAQPLDADLTAIATLTGTSGFLKKTAADTWTLDTNTYLTANQTITLSGDVSGSGTTSIEVTIADDSHNHIINNIDGLQTALDGKEPTITAGTTSQYWRGDKSWQTLDKSAVGLSNVENTAISTWAGSSNITTVGTLTNLTVTNTITGSISGNAGTVTNGVYTTGSYSDPAWITAIGWSKISSTPTTLSGYGITDAQPLDADLTAIAALSGTGIARRTGANTWEIDTNTYLTTSTASSTYAPLASPTFTGTVNFTGATVTGIDLLPNQSGNSGKYLTTNGTNASWGTINVEPTIHPMFIIGGV